jgi:hypothetical protein
VRSSQRSAAARRTALTHPLHTRVRSGVEACISYGEDLSNAELVDRYGFSLGASNPNGEEKRKVLNRYG